jgi:hypothetical protein
LIVRDGDEEDYLSSSAEEDVDEVNNLGFLSNADVKFGVEAHEGVVEFD